MGQAFVLGVVVPEGHDLVVRSPSDVVCCLMVQARDVSGHMWVLQVKFTTAQIYHCTDIDA